MYVLREFGVALPEGQVRMPAGTGRVARHAYALPGGGVWDAYGGQVARRALATVQFDCVLHGSDIADLKTQYRALQGALGTWEDLKRSWGCDGAVEWCPARLEDIQAYASAAHPLVLPVSLFFTLLRSVWWTGDKQQANIATGASANCANPGNATHYDAVVTFTCATNMAGGFRVRNTTLANVGFSYTGALVATDVVIVDCGAKSVLKNGSAAYADFELVGEGAGWLPLASSGNVIEVTALSGGTGSADVEWYETYN